MWIKKNGMLRLSDRGLLWCYVQNRSFFGHILFNLSCSDRLCEGSGCIVVLQHILYKRGVWYIPPVEIVCLTLISMVTGLHAVKECIKSEKRDHLRKTEGLRYMENAITTTTTTTIETVTINSILTIIVCCNKNSHNCRVHDTNYHSVHCGSKVCARRKHSIAFAMVQ